MGEKTYNLMENSPLLKREMSNLGFLYHYVFHPNITISQYEFYYDFIHVLPNSKRGTSDRSTISRYVSKQLPKYVIKYWEDADNKDAIQNDLFKSMMHYLKSLSQRQEFNKKLLNDFLGFLHCKEENVRAEKYFASYISDMNNEKNLYYDIFLYCVTNIIANQYSALDMEKFEEEYLLIVKKYGISGTTGKNVILNLARNGSRNPLILFEAGEIEYNNRRWKTGSLAKAYFYYHKAQILGYPLASWAIGYMIEHNSTEDANNTFIPTSEQERLEKAFNLYKIAADSGCSKAFNSIGNLIARKKITNFDVSDAKFYYQKSAESGNVFGMSNYACTLEKELIAEKNMRERGCSKKEDTWIIQTGREMIHNFENSADLGYDFACLKVAQYYGNFDQDEIANFDKNGISFINVDIDKAIIYLHKCINSAQNDISALAGYYLASYLYNQGNESAIKDAYQILRHISLLNISKGIKQKIFISLNRFNEDELHKATVNNIFNNYRI